MIVLAIDTTLGACSVALRKNNVIIGSAEETERSRQAECLVPMIESLLQRHKLTFVQLDLLVCTVGPGSFTGVRIGMTVAKGLACVTNIPTAGVSSLQCVASSEMLEEKSGNRLSVINALRGQVYVQRFSRDNKALSEAEVIDISEVKNYARSDDVLVGNAGGVLPDFEFFLALPHAKEAIVIGQEKFEAVGGEDLVPLYIRPPDAKLPS